MEMFKHFTVPSIFNMHRMWSSAVHLEQSDVGTWKWMLDSVMTWLQNEGWYIKIIYTCEINYIFNCRGTAVFDTGIVLAIYFDTVRKFWREGVPVIKLFSKRIVLVPHSLSQWPTWDEHHESQKQAETWDETETL